MAYLLSLFFLLNNQESCFLNFKLLKCSDVFVIQVFRGRCRIYTENGTSDRNYAARLQSL